MIKLENSFYFHISVRSLCILNCVIVLFCVALSQGWTSRAAAVIGMVFTIVSLMLIGSSLATLFTWDLVTMGLPKRCLFVFLFLLTSLISGIMFLLATATCDSYSQYGCFQTYYSGAFKVAAAFSFISVVFALGDVGLNFFFYFRDRSPRGQTDSQVAQYDPNSTVNRSIPQISIIGADEPLKDSSYETRGHSTYV